MIQVLAGFILGVALAAGGTYLWLIHALSKSK